MGNSESSIRSSLQNKPTVVIIGGGYGGVQAASSLEKDFNVVVLERNNFFYHSIGSLRGLVSSEAAQGVVVPYTKLLKFGQVIQAEVEQVSKAGIKIKGREALLRYDYLVIATGGSSPFPSKSPVTEANDILGLFAKSQAAIEKANNILIVGGGVVGVELLGELTHHFPNKNYTIVNSQGTLISDPVRDDFKNLIQKLIEKTPNVNLILDDKVVLEEKSDRLIEGKRTVETEKGVKIETDLILLCVGSKPNNASFKDTFPVDGAGRIKVNEFLQVEGYERIFALGDCANFPEGKTAFAAKGQSASLAHNIKALEESLSLKPHQPFPPGMFVTYGPSKGHGQLPLGSGPIVGSFLVSALKGKDLFISRTWADFGLTRPSASEGVDYDAREEEEVRKEKIKRFSAALEMDEDGLRKLIEKVQKEGVRELA